MLLLCFLFLLLVSSLIHIATYVFSRIEYKEEGQFCERHFPEGEISTNTIYAIFAFLGMYAIPLLIILFCYAQILLQIWQKSTGRTESAQAQSRALRRKRKITKMVFIVVLLFAICWAPIQIFSTWFLFNPDAANDANMYLHGAFLCLAYSNSCVNPFVYAFTTTGFKKYFRQLFGPCCGSCLQDKSHTTVPVKTKTDRLTSMKEESSM